MPNLGISEIHVGEIFAEAVEIPNRSSAAEEGEQRCIGRFLMDQFFALLERYFGNGFVLVSDSRRFLQPLQRGSKVTLKMDVRSIDRERRLVYLRATAGVQHETYLTGTATISFP